MSHTTPATLTALTFPSLISSGAASNDLSNVSYSYIALNKWITTVYFDGTASTARMIFTGYSNEQESAKLFNLALHEAIGRHDQLHPCSR